MPRGKELEQLPMANIAPGAGEDSTDRDREMLQGIVQDDRATPAGIKNEKNGDDCPRFPPLLLVVESFLRTDTGLESSFMSAVTKWGFLGPSAAAKGEGLFCFKFIAIHIN